MWFKNRRAKWRKRERNAMNAAAAAAADFKPFTPQFNGLVQSFGAAAAASDEVALYAGYAPQAYNTWASKVPSPLAGTTKSFPWGLNSVNMSGFAPGPPQMVNSNISMAGSSIAMGGQPSGPCMQHYANASGYPTYRDQPAAVSTPTSTVTTPTASARGFGKGAPAGAKPGSASSGSSTASTGSGMLYAQPASPRSSAAMAACQFDRSPI